MFLLFSHHLMSTPLLLHLLLIKFERFEASVKSRRKLNEGMWLSMKVKIEMQRERDEAKP